MSTVATREEGKSKARSGWKTGVAGVVGNLALLVFQPLENVKFRMQANDGMRNNHLPKYNGFIDTFKQMYKNEGIVSLYRGMYITFFASAVSAGVFFTVYGDGKKRYNFDRKTSPLWLNMFISLRAGVIATFVMTPLWCIKTRVILNWNEKFEAKRGHEVLKDTVKDMYTKEGLKSFYRGLAPQLFLSLYAVLNMAIYENLSRIAGIEDKKEHGSTPDIKTFFVGGTAKCISSATFYPVSLIKTRLQKQRYTGDEAEKLKRVRNITTKGTEQKDVYYTSIRKTASNIWANEGIRGFYKGCLPNLVRIFPNSGLFFLLFETTHRVLDKI